MQNSSEIFRINKCIHIFSLKNNNNPCKDKRGARSLKKYQSFEAVYLKYASRVDPELGFVGGRHLIHFIVFSMR